MKPFNILHYSWSALLIFTSIPCALAQDPVQILKISDADRNNLSSIVRRTDDRFGHSVAIHGKFAVAGTPHYHSLLQTDPTWVLPNSGAAFLYENIAGTWTMVKKLEPDTLLRNSDEFMRFGYSVAIHGNTIVVGVFPPAEPDPDDLSLTPRQKGAAYIFSKDHGGPGNWGQVKKLIPPTPEPFGRFGYSVAIYENTVIVGAPFDALDSDEQHFLENAGAVYVYQKDPEGGENWGL
ncbi:MAG TPA: hypothetical protein VK907_03600, partial [Phnomibacter sp.]|nr:hypothetical protein [Phnomibacter sp.]